MTHQLIQNFSDRFRGQILASALAIPVTAAAALTSGAAEAQILGHTVPQPGTDRYEQTAPFEQAFRSIGCCGYKDFTPDTEIIYRPEEGSGENYIVRYYRTGEGLPLSEPVDVEWHPDRIRDEEYVIRSCATRFANDMATQGFSTCVPPPFDFAMDRDNIRLDPSINAYVNVNDRSQVFPIGPDGELPEIPAELFEIVTRYCYFDMGGSS